jgi:hypothetical protein
MSRLLLSRNIEDGSGRAAASSDEPAVPSEHGGWAAQLQGEGVWPAEAILIPGLHRGVGTRGQRCAPE